MNESSSDQSNLVKDAGIAYDAAKAEKPLRDVAGTSGMDLGKKDVLALAADVMSDKAIESGLKQQFLDKDWLTGENDSLIVGRMSVDQIKNALKPVLGRNLDQMLGDVGLTYDEKVAKITGMTRLLNDAVGLEMRGTGIHEVVNMYRETLPRDGADVLEMVFALSMARGYAGRAMEALSEAAVLLGLDTAELVVRNLSTINESYRQMEEVTYQPLDVSASTEAQNAKIDANNQMRALESSMDSLGFKIQSGEGWVRT